MPSNLPPPWDDDAPPPPLFWKPEPGDNKVRILPSWQEAERLKYAQAKADEIEKLKRLSIVEQEKMRDPRRGRLGDVVEWRCECGTRWKYGDLCADCGRYRPEYAEEKYRLKPKPVCTLCGLVVGGGLTVHTGCAARAMQGLQPKPADPVTLSRDRAPIVLGEEEV